MMCYRLVITTRDKAIALAKGLVVEVFGLGLSWSMLANVHDPVVQDFWPLWLAAFCILVLLVGPLVFIDALTMSVCITDKGISRVSIVSRRGEREPWIDWEHLVSVDVRSNSRCASGIEKVVVRGQREIHGLGGAYWQPRLVVIPGHLPDIQHILANLREIAPDKYRQ